MKVLWLANISLPEACLLMGQRPSPLGGWLQRASVTLSKQPGIELSIAFPHRGVRDHVRLQGQSIVYYAFRPVTDRDARLAIHNTTLDGIIDKVRPDIVHIHGTEMPHAAAMVNICDKRRLKAVISIQGLVSVIAKHITAGLPFTAVYGTTLRNLIRNDSVRGLQRLLTERGKNEVVAIRKVDHVIGRTTWDRVCALSLNPSVEYHFCNETLRDEFYNHEWGIADCEKHSIFVSQAHYPVKGFHYLLEAMPMILERFPDTQVYVSGKDITRLDTLMNRIQATHYGRYLRKLIRHHNLSRHVHFLGMLDEKQMCERYLRSHVFVCPSSIENSPNSLAEAMILGVPCVASYVGGVPDMLSHGVEGYLYQADAPYMLAHYVCEIFSDTDLAISLSTNARRRALTRHDPQTNTRTLLEIYGKIFTSCPTDRRVREQPDNVLQC